MQVRVDGVANLRQMKREFASVTAQVKTMNAAMAESALAPTGNAASWQKNAAAMQAANRTFNASLASSGLFRIEQMKMGDAIERNTDLLQRQKLKWNEVFGQKSRRMMKNIYVEQMAMQEAFHKTVSGGIGDGTTRTTFAIPKDVSKSWDSFGNRVGMVGYQLSSASAEMVNWGKNTQWAGRQLMAGISMPIAAFGAAAGYMAYQVDKEFTRIQKVYDTTADANSANIEEQIAAQKELDRVREQGAKTAVNAAREYGSAMAETLEVQAELAATGQKGAELQKNTSEIMRISMLGEIDHATTTKSLIALQATLGATVEETTAAFDYMNSIENATSLTTADFAAAIPRALGPMKQMSAEGETTIGVLQNMSTLMVAMRERGIEAGEGANAIKAMMQRLYRPSKQVREEWVEITKIDPADIVERAGGDIMKILPMISAAVRDLDNAARTKALAGLFGTWQVQRMNAMLEGIDAMGEGIGQMGSVLDVNGQSWQDWADVAAQEQKKAAESASGQFKRALETVKAELAIIGEDFLTVATWFLKGVMQIAELFNQMPGWAKKTAIFVAIFAGLIGPAVMLTGLFANLIGNVGKMTGWFLKLIGTFELLNKKQWAAKLSGELVQRGFVSQTDAAIAQTRQIQALTLAMQEMMIVQSQLGGITIPASVQQAVAARNAQAGTSTLQNMMSTTGPLTGAQAAMGATIEDAYKNANQGQQILVNGVRQEEESRKRIGKFMAGAAASTTLMAGSMATMMLTSNETANNIAKFAMIASLVVPAAQAVIPVIGRMGSKFSKAATAAGGMARVTSGIGGAVGVIGKGFAGMASPIGLAALGVTAVVGGLYLLHKRNEQIYRDAVEQQDRLNNSSKAYAETMGKVAGEYDRISHIASDLSEKQESEFDKDLNYYQNDKVGKQTIEDIDAESDLDIAMAQKFVDLQIEGGLTAAEAAVNLRAIYVALGQDMDEAQASTRRVVNEMGNLKNATSNWIPALDNQQRMILNNLKEWEEDITNDDVLKETTSKYADMFSTAFENTRTPEEAKEVFAQITDTALTQWDSMYEKLGNYDSMAKIMKEENLKDGRDLSVWWRELQQNPEELNKVLGALSEEGGAQLRALFEGGTLRANKFEQTVIGAVAETNKFPDHITTVWELETHDDIEARMLTLTEADAKITGMAENLRNLLYNSGGPTPFGFVNDAIEDTRKETMRLKVNALNVANGFKEGATWTEALYNWENKVVDESANAADEVKRLRKNVDDIPKEVEIKIKADQLKEIHQAGMEGAVEDATNAISDDFDRAMNDSIDAQSNSWDNRIEALQDSQERAADAMSNRHEREMEKFESRWEARKDRVTEYYDKRIENINKTMEAEQRAEDLRQRIFEAEQTRLDRLAESANRTIDFNMALQTGELDEAAKLRNDMEAQAQEWALADAGAAGQSAAERRQRRLEKRADRLTDRKDEVLEQIDKREEAQRKSLERRQDAERKHLDKVQKMNLEHLQDQAENAKETHQEMWESRRDNLDKELDLAKAMVPKNKRQMNAWLNDTKELYRKYGIDFLEPTSEKWGGYFKKSYKEHTRQAGAEIANSNMWERFGAKQARKQLRGMGFGSIPKFKKFIMTGELPDDFGQVRSQGNGRNRGPVRTVNTNGKNGGRNTSGGLTINHQGGWVDGSGGSGRKGVARNYKGVHPSEQMMLARKGEFVVNEDAARDNANVLEDINSGRTPRDTKGVGGAGGIGGLISAFTSMGLAQGVGQSYQRAYEKKQAEMVSLASTGLGGMLGNYSLPGVKPWVLEAANYLGGKYGIATIGGVGERTTNPTSDHPKGLALDFMTNNIANGVAVGNALAKEAIEIYRKLDATYLIWRARIHSFDSRGWQNYSHPSGATDPTSMHMDHVHISFSPTGDVGDLPSLGGMSRLGTSGLYYPANRGKGWANSHDYDNDFHDPVYAIADGYVSARQSPPSAGSGQHPNAYPRGYGSYGVHSYLTLPGGTKILYAHLWPGTQASGRVKAGQQIAEAASTGNSSGSHTHFEVNGSERAREWFAEHGIGLRTGGVTTRDGIANLHKDEVVVDPDRTKKLFKGMDSWFESVEEIKKKKNRRRNPHRRPKGIGDEWREFGTPDPYAEGNGWTWMSGALQLLGKAAAISNSRAKTTDLPGGIGHGVRIGTYNVHWGTRNEASQQDLLALMGSADILNLQELGKDKRALLPWLNKQGWGTYSPRYGTGLAWNKSKIKGSNFGSQKLSNSGIAHNNAVYGRFAPKGGAPFWDVSAHTIWRGGAGGATKGIQAQQYKSLGALNARLSSSGAAVIMGGDFNLQETSIRQLESILGMKSNRARGIDHLFYNNARGGTVATRKLHSDHPALLSTFNIPGMDTGGHIKWDNTLANLHKKETVLTEDLSEKFRRGVDNFADGGNTEYNVNVYVTNPDASADEIATKVEQRMRAKEARKPQRRTNRL